MSPIRRTFVAATIAACCSSFVAGMFTITKKALPNSVSEQLEEVGTDAFIFTPNFDASLPTFDLFGSTNGWENGVHSFRVSIYGADDNLIEIVSNGIEDGKYVKEYDETNKNEPFEFFMVGKEDDIMRTATYNGNFIIKFECLPGPACTLLVPGAAGLEGPFTVSVTDNDVGTAVVVLSDDFPYPPDILEGRAQNYDVQLQSIPVAGAKVVVTFTPNNDTLSATPGTLSFDASNWNVIQKVAIGAVDDSTVYPSPHTASFGITQASEDPNFNGIALSTVFVTIEDNDFVANLGYSAITWSAVTLSGQGSNVELTAVMTVCVVKSGIPDDKFVGDTIDIDASISVGGEISMTSPTMTIKAIDSLYATLEIVIVHKFVNTAGSANPPRVLSITQCCRQRELLNNRESKRTTMVLADLDYVAASPVVGTVPTFHLPVAESSGPRNRRALESYAGGGGSNSASWPTSRARRSSQITTFQIPAYSSGNPLKYTLGSTAEYGNSLLGSPYGLAIDQTTGIVTWDTSTVPEGLWNLVVVVEDLVTYGAITVEFLVNIYETALMPDLSCIKCGAVQFLEVGTEFTSPFGATGKSGPASLADVGGLPSGGLIDGNTFKWTPTADQVGAYVQCFQAVESVAGHISAPQCITMVVKTSVGAVPSLTVTTAAQFQAGGDGPATIASTATLTLAAGSATVTEVTVELANVKDVGFEELTVDPGSVSLSLGIAQPRSETLIVKGIADVGVFQTFLRNVKYTNSLDMPTVGDRTILLKVFTSDGMISVVKTVTMSVGIKNTAPVFHLDKNDTGLDYSTIFYRSGEPVLISGEALLTDDDSYIESATVTLGSIPDGADEMLPADRGNWQQTQYDNLYDEKHEKPLQRGIDLISKALSTFTLLASNGKKSLTDVETKMRAMRYINLNHDVADGSERLITFQVEDEKDGLNSKSDMVSTIITLASTNTEPITTVKELNADGTKREVSYDILEDAGPTRMNIAELFVDDHDHSSSSAIASESMPTATIKITTNVTFGTIEILDDGASITFTPAEDDHGVREYGVKVCDTDQLCSEELMFKVTIESVNDKPYQTSYPLLFNITEGTDTSLDFTQFFYDVEDYHREPEGYNATFDGFREGMTTVAFGTGRDLAIWSLRKELSFINISPKEATDVALSPREGVSSDFSDKGDVIIFFEVCDSEDACQKMNVTVHILDVNGPPTIGTKFGTNVTMIEESPDGGPDVRVVGYGMASYLAVDEDAAVTMELDVEDIEDDFSGRTVDTVVSSQSAHGTTEVNFGVSEYCADDVPCWTITYTPDPDYYGSDVVALTATDSKQASTTEYINIRVQAVRDPPRVVIDALVVPEDVTKSFQMIGNIIIDPEEYDGEVFLESSEIFLLSGGDPKQEGLTVQTAEGATVTYDPAKDLLTYVPFKQFHGDDKFEVHACSSTFVALCPVALLPQERTLNSEVCSRLDDTGEFTVQKIKGDEECTTHTITVTVASNNDAPVVPADFEVSVYEDNELRIDMSQNITDVEDSPSGTAWVEIVFVVDGGASAAGETVPTTLGAIKYEQATGEIVFNPNLDAFGVEEIQYRVCDTEALCSDGRFTLNVLAVNDPPRVLDAFNKYMIDNPAGYLVEEDRWNIIYGQGAIYSDPDVKDVSVLELQELMNGEITPLRIEILSDATNGTVVEFAKSGFLSYQPNSNFVGTDSFVIRVCDVCSPLRNAEIRGTDDAESADPACIREREESNKSDGESVSGDGALDDNDADQEGCLTATILLKVRNVNDNIVTVDLSGKIETDDAANTKSLVFCPNDHVIEADDAQSDIVREAGGNPETYGLKNETDIDYGSLSVIEDPTIDGATVQVITGPQNVCKNPDATSLLYTVAADAVSDTDEFVYKICDKQSTCSKSSAHVKIAKAAPQITSVTATPGTGVITLSSGEDAEVDTDSNYGVGDSFIIEFNMATNMAPNGTIDSFISGADLEKMISFSQPIAEANTGYYGKWTSNTELSVVIEDPGSVEFRIDVPNFEVSVNSKLMCGPFNVDSDVYIAQTETDFCLRNLDDTSFPVDDTNTGIEGERGWGGNLPDVIEVHVQCIGTVGTDYLGPGCTVVMVLSPLMLESHFIAHCGENGVNAASCMDLTQFGEGAGVTLSYEATFADNSTATANERRASASPANTRITLDFTSLATPAVLPSDTDNFFAAVRAAWRGTDPYVALSNTIATETGFPDAASAMVAYSNDPDQSPLAKFRAAITAADALYIEGIAGNTPVVDLVSYQGTGQTLQKIIIRFTSETNMPFDVASADASSASGNAVSMSGVDAMMIFDKDIGTYQGVWTSRSILEIQVLEVSASLSGVPTLTFRGNEDAAGDPTNNPCRGAQVCYVDGQGAGSWGICDRGETSCRVSGSYGVNAQSDGDAADGVTDLVFSEPDLSASTNEDEEITAAASTSSYAFLGFLILIPIVAGIIYYSSVKRSERAENKRAMKAFLQKKMTWNGDGADGKPVTLDASEMWNRPPGMVAMRSNPDPFLNLAGGTAAAPVAAKSIDPFAPRAAPTMKVPGLQAPNRGPTMAKGRPQVGMAALPALKGQGAPKGTGLPPPKLPPMGRKPGTMPGGNRVAPAGPGGGAGAFRGVAMRANIGNKVSKGDLFNLARRASNSSFTGPQTDDPFSRAAGSGSMRANSMPRRPNFKGMAGNVLNAGRMRGPGAPPMPRVMPGTGATGGARGPLSPPRGGMRGRGGPGRGMPMAPGRGRGGPGRGGQMMSPPGGRGSPRGRMSMAPRGRGSPGRGSPGRGAPGRGGQMMMPPPGGRGPAGANRVGPAPSLQAPRGLRPGDEGYAPQPQRIQKQPPGVVSDPFSRPGGPNSGAMKVPASPKPEPKEMPRPEPKEMARVASADAVKWQKRLSEAQGKP